MIELSISQVFDVSNPVEALEYDPKQYRLIVSSQHGKYTMYEIGRNGRFFLFLLPSVLPNLDYSETMIRLWQAAVNCDKFASITKSVRFYKSDRKVLIFVLESGEM